MNDLQIIPVKKGKKTKKTKKIRVNHSKETKTAAARYYLLGLTLPEISKLLDNVPIRTLEKWQLSDKWAGLKNPENIKIKVLHLFEAGKTRKQISNIVNRSECTVYRWIKEAKEQKI